MTYKRKSNGRMMALMMAGVLLLSSWAVPAWAQGTASDDIMLQQAKTDVADQTPVENENNYLSADGYRAFGLTAVNQPEHQPTDFADDAPDPLAGYSPMQLSGALCGVDESVACLSRAGRSEKGSC